MSITMSLEIESGATLDEIAEALTSIGERYDVDAVKLDFTFKNSGCNFSIRRLSCPEGVVAEGANLNWRVGLRGAFNCRVSNMEDSWNDIKIFLRELYWTTRYYFVLSFQYESVYVVRNREGLSFVRNMVD